MNILYISSVDVSLTSGPAANEREFIPILNSLLGSNSHFLIPKPKFSLPEDIPSNSYTFTFPHKNRNPLFWPLHQFSIINKAKKIIKEKKIDLIVLRIDIFPIAFRYLTKSIDLPYAIKTAENGKFEVFDRKNKIYRLLKSLNLNLYSKLINDAILVDVVSESIKDSLQEVTNSKNIICIDNGVNTERFYPKSIKEVREKLNLTEFNPIIGYCGNLPWERGALQIIEALPNLKKIYPDIGALIIGSGDKMDLLYDKADKLNVMDRCFFTGQVNYDEVPDYINSMDIAVSLRYKDTQHASELKVRQYIACGKPTIVSPGSNDFVEEEEIGYIVDPNNINQFCDAVIKIFHKIENQEIDVTEKARSYSIENLSYKSKVLERLNKWSVKV